MARQPAYVTKKEFKEFEKKITAYLKSLSKSLTSTPLKKKVR